MDLTTNVADFRSFSNQLQRNGNSMSIYDYFILDDTSLNQRQFFIGVACESLSKKV